MKNKIKQMAVLIGIALTVSVQAQAQMPKPVTDDLPGLSGQTNEWWEAYRKAQTEENARKKQAQIADVESNFYTGKPYDADLGGYVFKYRNYSPEIQRWTTADPSGFPDGANNYGYVSAPTVELDWQGLLKLSEAQNTGETTTVDYDTEKAIYQIWTCLTDDGNYTITLWKYVSGGPGIADGFDLRYNCHGYTFANSQYWIDSMADVQNILKGDGYKEIVNSDYSNARIGIWSAGGGHSAFVRGEPKDSVTSVEGKIGNKFLKQNMPSKQWDGPVKYYE